MKRMMLVTTSLLLAACGSGTPDAPDEPEAEGGIPGAVVEIPDLEVDPGPNPVITILPPVSEAETAVDYCDRDGDDLLVQFQNIGGLATGGSVDVDVTFETSNGQVVLTRTRGPLGVGEIATLTYPIPLGCFNADCDFAITWSNQGPVGGRCIG